MTTHDFTNLRWGHNLSIMNHTLDDGIPRYRVASWSSKTIETGDEILWRTDNRGTATLVVEAREPAPNVWDMAFLNLRLVSVEEEDGTLVLAPTPKEPTSWDKFKAIFSK